ncbi:MAG: FHA domain-containing protein [Spirochaetes bacterium]|nr:FHA domain-containing protein [Spirochaetota bacterium]
MSTLMKKIFLCIIGVLAALAAWSVVEIVMLFQEHFPSYLLFSIVLGIMFGIFMGGFFGTSEGIILADKSKRIKGIITGVIVGMIGGIIGFLIGQAALFIIGDQLIHSMKRFNTIGFPISRSIGWASLGIFIGIAEGIRAKSLNKIKVGIIGGLIGGALGGLALEYIRLILADSIMIARLIGFLIFGFFIGLFYGLVEKRLSYGILRLLNGKFKGKEFLINQRKIKIGSSKKNDITLSDYEQIADFHAQIRTKKTNVIIKNLTTKVPVTVNDDIINEHKLKIEDVIKIGNAKFLFKYR